MGQLMLMLSLQHVTQQCLSLTNRNFLYSLVRRRSNFQDVITPLYQIALNGFLVEQFPLEQVIEQERHRGLSSIPFGGHYISYFHFRDPKTIFKIHISNSATGSHSQYMFG